MQSKKDVDLSFNVMRREAEMAGLDVSRMEIRWGSSSANYNHALLGPEQGRVTYLGTSYGNACRFMDGMAKAFRMIMLQNRCRAEEAAARNTPAEAAVLAAEIDPNVVRLGDHFEADEK